MVVHIALDIGQHRGVPFDDQGIDNLLNVGAFADVGHPNQHVIVGQRQEVVGSGHDLLKESFLDRILCGVVDMDSFQCGCTLQLLVGREDGGIAVGVDILLYMRRAIELHDTHIVHARDHLGAVGNGSAAIV